MVNLSVLEESFEAGAEINREVLEARGLISKETLPLKVLADGDLTKAFKVTADRFSNAAKEKIEKAGGTATFLKPSSAEAKAARKAAFIAAKKEAVAKRKAAAAARGE